MALRNVVKEGDEILTKKCRPVEKFDDRLGQLLDDMGETVLDADGLGLAGPQVGVLRRIFVAVDDSGQPEAAEGEDAPDYTPAVIEFINPEIVSEEGEQYGYEGCLSFPMKYGAIRRPQRVVCKAQDRTGQPFTFEAEGLLARCLCHEANHLDGVTITDLADYFYDPDEPHELDADLFDGDDDGDEADEA